MSSSMSAMSSLLHSSALTAMIVNAFQCVHVGPSKISFSSLFMVLWKRFALWVQRPRIYIRLEIVSMGSPIRWVKTKTSTSAPSGGRTNWNINCTNGSLYVAIRAHISGPAYLCHELAVLVWPVTSWHVSTVSIAGDIEYKCLLPGQ